MNRFIFAGLLAFGGIIPAHATGQAQAQRPIRSSMTTVMGLDTTHTDTQRITALVQRFFQAPDSVRYTPALWNRSSWFDAEFGDLASRFCGRHHATLPFDIVR